MRVHYFQHVAFEGLGSIEPWLRAHECEISATRFFETPDIPPLRAVDLLIVLGGPMSVNDEDRLPWLVPEKAAIRAAIDAGTAVLGICLGAQLIANAFGARVYRAREKEIGWFTIHAVESAEQSTFRFPPALDVFHWHGETFDLPDGATLLASSQACAHQAFQLGPAVGLQFHLETTPEAARTLVSNCGEDLDRGTFVQAPDAILSTGPDHYAIINTVMADVLTYLSARTTRGAR